ncbi:MAG: hypothetical protein KAT71_08225 [Gammaproteobacteria bacterium]|nr:hypothetical protein [Gammaproteobacteria bacterium]
MKDILQMLFAFALFLGTVGGIYYLMQCDDVCQQDRAQVRLQQAQERALEVERSAELSRVYHEAKVAELKRQAEIEALKTPEQRLLEQQLEVQKAQADSVGYLENSAKVRDVIEGAQLGWQVFNVLTE